MLLARASPASGWAPSLRGECPHVGAHQSDDRDVRAEIWLKLHAPELFARDVDARLGGAADVTEFPAPVKVHDRHGHRAEERRGPERGCSLQPVRQWQSDHVAGADAGGAEPGGEPARLDLDVMEGAC